jgi:hypothetical protein
MTRSDYATSGGAGESNYEPNDTGESVRQLNSFLRGEISAAETYRMAIDKVAAGEQQSANVGMLREIQEEHGRAAQAIRDRIRELGGEPSDSSGAWGAWAKFTQGTANLFGDASALKSLKEGEEHGLKDYEEGLDDVDMTSGRARAEPVDPGAAAPHQPARSTDQCGRRGMRLRPAE